MLHLPADRLAELVDNEPTPQELAHLQSCTACARERSAFVALRELAAAERDKPAEPLLSWDSLRQDLVAGGLVANQAHGGSAAGGAVGRVGTPRSGFNLSRISLRIAAGFLLMTTGIAVGRFSERAGILTAAGSVQATTAQPAAGTTGAASGAVPSFASADEAMEVLLRSQQEYQLATAFLVASDTTIGSEAPHLYKERLAALDQVMGVTRSALARAPQDPVINSYYLATVGAREATLQQLQLALPEGTQIDRF